MGNADSANGNHILPSDLGKKQNDHCRVKVELKQYWNWTNQMQDPIFPHACQMNIVNAQTDQHFELKVQC